MVELAEGMIDGGGKQHGIPTDKLKHGAKRPKPWNSGRVDRLNHEDASSPSS